MANPELDKNASIPLRITVSGDTWNKLSALQIRFCLDQHEYKSVSELVKALIEKEYQLCISVGVIHE